MAEMDDMLVPNPDFIIKETDTGKDMDSMLVPDPRYNLDVPKQPFDLVDTTNKLKLLNKEEFALKVNHSRTPDQEARLGAIEDEKTDLVVPRFQSEEYYQSLGEQTQGLQYAQAPWELFLGITSGQTIARLGTATLKGVLTRAVTIGGIAAVTDIPIEMVSQEVAEDNPWLGVALSVGLSIPMAIYVDTRLEERVFRKILFKNPKFFSDNLSKIVSFNTKNISKQVKARIDVLKNRMSEGDYAAFLESQALIRASIYEDVPPVKLTKLPSEDIKIPTRKSLNAAALQKSFTDVVDNDLAEIQALAQVDSFKGFEVEFTKVKNKVNSKLALEAYRNHPITAMTETIKRTGGFAEDQIVKMIGQKATDSLKKRFPRLVQKVVDRPVTDVAVKIVKKILPRTKVRVVATPGDLPKRFERFGDGVKNIRGAYSAKLDELVLVKSKLKSPRDGVFTAVHEIVHAKMQKYKPLFKAIYKANRAAIDKIADSGNVAYKGWNAVDEWLAREVSIEMLTLKKPFSFDKMLEDSINRRLKYVPPVDRTALRHDLDMTLKTGQVNPIHKAVAHDYNSVEEMLYDFMQMPTLKKIRASINSQMEYDWSKIYLDEYATRVGGTELKMWEKIGGKKLVQRTRAAAAKDAKLIGTRPKLLRTILDEANFIRKVGTQAVKATLRTVKAQARLTQLARAEALKSSVKEKATITKITGDLKNSLRDGAIPYDYQVQVHGYLAPYVKGAIANDPGQLTLREFLTIKADDGVPVAKLIRAQYGDILELPSTTPRLENLTLDQYKKINGLMKDIRKMGKKELVVDKLAIGRTVGEYVAPIKATADKTFLRKQEAPTQREWLATKPSRIRNSKTAITDKHQKWFSELKRAEFILRELDAWEEFGPAQKLMQTAKKAEDIKYQVGKVLRERWEGLMEGYAKSLGKRVLHNKFWDKMYKDSVVDFGATKERMLTMAGMTGNTHNKAAMLNSVGVSEVVVNRFLRENMSKQDWDFVKNIWKMTDEMYDMLNTVHKRMRNAPLPKVKNYWPIIPDYFFSKKPPKQAVEDVFLDMPHLQKVSRAVQKRFLHARVGNSDAIRMDFTGLAKHLRDVAHTVSHWEATDDIRKVITNRTFKDTVVSNLGEPKYKVLKQWYEDLVQPAPTDAPGFRKLRANVTVAALGFKLTAAIVQPLSAISAIPRVGAVNMLWAMTTFSKNPRRFIRTINEISEQMAGRDNAWQRDIGDLLDMSQMKRFKKMGQLDRNVFFSFIRTMDKVGAYPTWYAGWRRGMKKFDGDSDKAVMFADKSVRMTQPQSSIKDLPNIMKGAEWKRSITMFYSYYNVLMNQTTELMQRARFDSKIGFWEVASALNYMYVIPPIAASIIKEREVNPEAIAKNMVTHLAGGIPIFRDMVSSGVMGYDYTMSPVGDVFKVGANAITRLGTATMGIAEGDFEWKMQDAYLLSKGLGYGFGIPSAQAMTIVRGLMDLAKGEDTDPLDILVKRAESKKD